jgi:tetratricopeptide (TPR) repeat protein
MAKKKASRKVTPAGRSGKAASSSRAESPGKKSAAAGKSAGKSSSAKKPAAKASTSKKASPKKPAGRAAAAKPAARKAAKKPTSAVKTVAGKKGPVRKPPAKKPTTRKPPAKKKPVVEVEEIHVEVEENQAADAAETVSLQAAAEEGAKSAAAAIENGDWQAALAGLAAAIDYDPFKPSWLAMLDRAIELGGEKPIAKHLERGGHKPYLGFEGIKIYFAYRRGDLKAAFNELENVTRNFKNTLYAEAWGIGWIDEPAIRAVGSQAMIRFLVSILQGRYPEDEESNDFFRTHLNRAIAALELVERVAGPTDMTVLFKGQMLSKAGRKDEAIAMAEQAAERNPTFRTATAAGMANKRSGDFERAIHWFQRASDLEPKEESCLLDIGDICIDRELWQRALDAYEEAMKRKPNHDWAYPSAVYCRYRLTGEPALLEELRYMANAGPDECGMASIMKQMFGGYNFEDRRVRAEALMKLSEPDFVPTPRPHEHDHGEDDEDDGDEEHDEVDEADNA